MNTTPPLTPLSTTNEFKCVVCEKQFASNRGLSRHKNTIRKYNEISAEEIIPDFLVNKFKENIVYLIHQRLNKNSKNVGLQTISITCPKILFKAIFKNYIHYYTKRTGVLKCVFRGSIGYQDLANIFNNSNWGVKHHPQGQQTYIQLASHNNQLQEEHPLIKLRQQKAALIKNYSRKPRYPYGEVIIEWKQKKDIDAKGNVCQSGFIYVHFFVSKKMFRS